MSSCHLPLQCQPRGATIWVVAHILCMGRVRVSVLTGSFWIPPPIKNLGITHQYVMGTGNSQNHPASPQKTWGDPQIKYPDTQDLRDPVGSSATNPISTCRTLSSVPGSTKGMELCTLKLLWATPNHSAPVPLSTTLPLEKALGQDKHMKD